MLHWTVQILKSCGPCPAKSNLLHKAAHDSAPLRRSSERISKHCVGFPNESSKAWRSFMKGTLSRVLPLHWKQFFGIRNGASQKRNSPDRLVEADRSLSAPVLHSLVLIKSKLWEKIKKTSALLLFFFFPFREDFVRRSSTDIVFFYSFSLWLFFFSEELAQAVSKGEGRRSVFHRSSFSYLDERLKVSLIVVVEYLTNFFYYVLFFFPFVIMLEFLRIFILFFWVLIGI